MTLMTELQLPINVNLEVLNMSIVKHINMLNVSMFHYMYTSIVCNYRLAMLTY